MGDLPNYKLSDKLISRAGYATPDGDVVIILDAHGPQQSITFGAEMVRIGGSLISGIMHYGGVMSAEAIKLSGAKLQGFTIGEEQPLPSAVPAAPAQESAMDDAAALSTIRTLLDRISILGQQLAAKGAPIAFAHERAVNDLDPNAFAALALEMGGDVARMQELAVAVRTLIQERARR